MSHGRRRAGLAFVGLVAVAGAGASVGGSLGGCSSLDGLTSDDGGASSDASTCPGCGADATTTEAGGGDASDDANTKTDAAPSGYCATLTLAPTFCFDFDPPSTLAGFEDHTSSTASPTLDATDAVSAPNAFFLSRPATTGSFSSYLSKTLSMTASATLEVAFDVKLVATQLYALEIELTSGSLPPYRFELQPGNESFYFAEKLGENNTLHDASLPSLPKSWTRLRFRLDFAAATYALWLGPSKVLDQPMGVGSHNGTPKVSLGAMFHANTAMSLRVDNLVIDAK